MLPAFALPQALFGTQDGMAMDEDALHLLPKVMAPYETKPGETPRRVQIQRCGAML